MVNFIQLYHRITKDRTKISKGKESGDDTIPGHVPQAWQKLRGVPIPVTQVSFGGEDDGGGDALSHLLSNLRQRLKLSSLRSSFSSSSLNIFLHNATLLSCRKREGIDVVLVLLWRLDFRAPREDLQVEVARLHLHLHLGMHPPDWFLLLRWTIDRDKFPQRSLDPQHSWRHSSLPPNLETTYF